MGNDIFFQDNSDAVLAELENRVDTALEEIGGRAQTYAAALTPVDTGALRNSITHKVVGNEVYIGSNLYYAPYVELGTGIYATDGTGRKSPWAYKDKDGEEHWTRGMKPQHMLKKAVSDHDDEYKKVLEKHLKDE